MRLAIAGVMLAACASDTSPPAMMPTASRCAVLEGRTFASLVQGECGLGPNGPELCTWHVTFSPHDASSTAFAWQHSDYGVEGAVTCDGGRIVDAATNTARGTYDDTTSQLMWDGTTYAPE